MAIGWKRLGLRGALLLVSLHSLFPQAHPDGSVAGSLRIAANATAAEIYELTPHEVTSIAPVRGTEQLRVIGDIRPFQRVTLRAKTEGRIATLSAREGDTVRAGDTLVWFETSDLETEFRQREEEWEGAQAENRRALQTLRRLEHLATKNFATQDQLETAQNDVFVTGARVESAVARRDMARAAIRDAKVLAPFDGVVAQRSVGLGSRVAAGAELMEIIDIRSFEARVLVSTQDVTRVSVGQSAKLLVDGPGERMVMGAVTRISPVAVNETRRVAVYIRISEEDQTLRGGMFVSGSIYVGEETDRIRSQTLFRKSLCPKIGILVGPEKFWSAPIRPKVRLTTRWRSSTG